MQKWLREIENAVDGYKAIASRWLLGYQLGNGLIAVTKLLPSYLLVTN